MKSGRAEKGRAAEAAARAASPELRRFVDDSNQRREGGRRSRGERDRGKRRRRKNIRPFCLATMCPLRVILLFLSALLAGYFAFTSVTSNSTKPGGGGVSDATDEVLQVGSADDTSLVEGGNQNACKKVSRLVESFVFLCHRVTLCLCCVFPPVFLPYFRVH